MKGWNTIRYKNIDVYYLPELDGGGKDQLNEGFIRATKDLIGPVDTICEFCSGPGFIGFSLLANGLCNNLVLVDINPNALRACKKTIRENNLSKYVKTYLSDGLASVPISEKWDLVVSNPPHADGEYKGNKGEILLVDPDWQIHKKFYKNIAKHLNKSGSTLFVENDLWSSPSIFKDMFKKNGLKLKKIFPVKPSRPQILKIFLKKASFKNLRRIISNDGRKATGVNISSLVRNPHYFIWSRKA